MRVLHVGKFFPPFAGGIENFMHDLMAASADLGVEQAALVHADRPSGEAPTDAFPFLSELHRVPMRAQLAYAPVAPAFGRELDRMLNDFRPDVLHLHLPNTSAFWVLFSRSARRLPWVVHWHSDVVGPGLDLRLKLLYPAYWPFEQALLRRAVAVVATSPPYLESSRALGRWHDKTHVIPLGLAEARVQPSAGTDPWRRTTSLRVLALGRLVRYKGFEVLVDAAARREDLEVVILGDGARRGAIERRIPDAAADRIRLVGRADDEVRNRYLAGCDVLCMPSINRAEAFGLSLVEAMAAGKPQIGTRVPGSGMDWVIEEGRTGWMVEPGNADALSGVLQTLARDRALVREYGIAARAQFEQRFRIDTVARKIVAMYRELVE